MEIRQATPEELPEVLELLRTRRWDGPEALPRGRWFVAHEGGIVGCAQVVETQPGHSVVDKVLVHEDRREQGIGRRLMTAIMDSTPGTVYLCCHEERLRFYGHFGFEDLGYEHAPQSVRDFWVLVEDYPTEEGHVHFFLRARPQG